jgi:hypothetical protein
VGFLEGHNELNAGSIFEDLEEKQKNFIRVSIDLWIDGANGPSTRFHGFPNDREYFFCFVFKAKEGRQHHRFYGYLYHPLPISNQRFQLCVLCIHAMKNENDTDRSELGRVKIWNTSGAAKRAIEIVFADQEKDKQKGKVLKWNK